MVNLKFFCIFIIIGQMLSVWSKPYRRILPLGDEDGVTTREIDLNDFKQKQQILNQFNISPEEIERRRLKHMGSSTQTPQPIGNDPFRDIKENRKENIKNQILDVFQNRPSQEDTVHEMAAYPSCNQGNESQWQQDVNITYIFSSTIFEKKSDELYLDTAVLRLFKLNPDDPQARTTPKPNSCDDIDQQIRVTVSTVQRRSKRGETEDRKKRICNTMMLNVSHTGWVEIDVRRAINIWEKSERHIRSANGGNNNNNNNNNNNGNNGNNNKPVLVGWLTIEVHDEEERPLKPGLYFEPPKCSQAYPAIPWNFYRLYSWSAAEMEKVPRSPRLDVKLIDQRSQSSFNHHRIHNRFLNHRTRFSTNCNHNNTENNNASNQQQYYYSQSIFDELDESAATTSTTSTTSVANGAVASSSSSSSSSLSSSAQTTTNNDNIYENSSPVTQVHRRRHAAHELNHHNHNHNNNNNHHHNNHHHHSHQQQYQTERINSSE